MPDLHVSELKSEDIRPCTLCGGSINPIFRVIEIKHGAVAQGARELAGMQMMGIPLALADAFRSGPVGKCSRTE